MARTPMCVRNCIWAPSPMCVRNCIWAPTPMCVRNCICAWWCTNKQSSLECTSVCSRFYVCMLVWMNVHNDAQNKQPSLASMPPNAVCVRMCAQMYVQNETQNKQLSIGPMSRRSYPSIFMEIHTMTVLSMHFAINRVSGARQTERGFRSAARFLASLVYDVHVTKGTV